MYRKQSVVGEFFTRHDNPERYLRLRMPLSFEQRNASLWWTLLRRPVAYNEIFLSNVNSIGSCTIHEMMAGGTNNLLSERCNEWTEKRSRWWCEMWEICVFWCLTEEAIAGIKKFILKWRIFVSLMSYIIRRRDKGHIYKLSDHFINLPLLLIAPIYLHR